MPPRLYISHNHKCCCFDIYPGVILLLHFQTRYPSSSSNGGFSKNFAQNIHLSPTLLSFFSCQLPTTPVEVLVEDPDLLLCLFFLPSGHIRRACDAPDGAEVPIHVPVVGMPVFAFILPHGIRSYGPPALLTLLAKFVSTLTRRSLGKEGGDNLLSTKLSQTPTERGESSPCTALEILVFRVQRSARPEGCFPFFVFTPNFLTFKPKPSLNISFPYLVRSMQRSPFHVGLAALFQSFGRTSDVSSSSITSFFPPPPPPSFDVSPTNLVRPWTCFLSHEGTPPSNGGICDQ